MSGDVTATLVAGVDPTRLLQRHPGVAIGEGVMGDCFRTVIGCLVSAPSPSVVPHFAELAEFCPGPNYGWHAVRLARQWLRDELGFDLLVVEPADAASYGVPYLATVQSVAGPWRHCVLAEAGAIVHDPSGNLDAYRGAEIVQAEVLVHPYDPAPDEQVRSWAEVPS